MITLNCSQFPPVENVHGSDTRRFQTLHLGVQRFSKLHRAKGGAVPLKLRQLLAQHAGQ